MTFDVQNFPTDSLHKFRAIVGLVLMFGGIIYLFESVVSEKERMSEIRTKIEILKVQAHSLSEDSLKINSLKIQGEINKEAISNSRSATLWSVFLVASGIGMLMAQSGFRKWSEIQKLTDDILKRELHKQVESQS
jgi:uncharacterized membrane protein